MRVYRQYVSFHRNPNTAKSVARTKASIMLKRSHLVVVIWLMINRVAMFENSVPIITNITRGCVSMMLVGEFKTQMVVSAKKIVGATKGRIPSHNEW